MISVTSEIIRYYFALDRYHYYFHQIYINYTTNNEIKYIIKYIGFTGLCMISVLGGVLKVSVRTTSLRFGRDE